MMDFGLTSLVTAPCTGVHVALFYCIYILAVFSVFLICVVNLSGMFLLFYVQFYTCLMMLCEQSCSDLASSGHSGMCFYSGIADMSPDAIENAVAG